jgi:hypothetical protein
MHKGQPIAKKSDPQKSLDKKRSQHDQSKMHVFANVIHSLAKGISFKFVHDDFPHILGDEPLNRGPKMAELMLDPTDEVALLIVSTSHRT